MSRPIVTGQCAEVLNYIAANQPVLSFTLTADLAIPEAAARVHDLRSMGFDVITVIHSEIEFRGRIRRRVASYSLGVPAWRGDGFTETEGGEL